MVNQHHALIFSKKKKKKGGETIIGVLVKEFFINNYLVKVEVA